MIAPVEIPGCVPPARADCLGLVRVVTSGCQMVTGMQGLTVWHSREHRFAVGIQVGQRPEFHIVADHLQRPNLLRDRMGGL